MSIIGQIDWHVVGFLDSTGSVLKLSRSLISFHSDHPTCYVLITSTHFCVNNNLLKEEYTNLRINHDNLVLSHELLSNEPHDVTNNVVKIDIASSCDDLIVESIEQGSSSKGKKVVESDNYDDYVKLKNENEKAQEGS